MKPRDEAFSPETVDEAVDHLLRSASRLGESDAAVLVQVLEGFYKEDPRLRRVWDRLAERATATPPASTLEEKRSLPSQEQRQRHHSSSPLLQSPQERGTSLQPATYAPDYPAKRSLMLRFLGRVAAVLLLVALVGSLVTVLQLSRQKTSGQTAAPSPTSTPGSQAGKVIYSTAVEPGWVSRLAWSADGQRIVVVGNETHIWDAINGQHQLALSLTPSPLAGPAWAPKGNLLALPTTTSILIVDGQTGKTVATYGAHATTAAASSAGNSPLLRERPLGGAPTFGGITWSPDGKWIASTFSSATSASVVQVWNPQNGQLAYTLATEPGMGFGSISWSPDGAYIAASAWKWNATVNQLDVWSVATHQIVFQQSEEQFFDDVTWQPGSDNVAAVLLTDNAVNSAVLTIWNVATKQPIKTIPGVIGVSWSPDGKAFVYSNLGGDSTKAGVTIQDAISGQVVYTYQVTESTAQVVRMVGVWSPTGEYIATVENSESAPTAMASSGQAFVVRVWVA